MHFGRVRAAAVLQRHRTLVLFSVVLLSFLICFTQVSSQQLQPSSSARASGRPVDDSANPSSKVTHNEQAECGQLRQMCNHEISSLEQAHKTGTGRDSLANISEQLSQARTQCHAKLQANNCI
jgi:hypothetical protein